VAVEYFKKAGQLDETQARYSTTWGGLLQVPRLKLAEEALLKAIGLESSSPISTWRWGGSTARQAVLPGRRHVPEGLKWEPRHPGRCGEEDPRAGDGNAEALTAAEEMV